MGVCDCIFFINCTVRVVTFAIDPQAERGIIPRVRSQISFNIPLILWIAGAFLLVQCW